MAEYRLLVLKKNPKAKNLPFIEPASKKGFSQIFYTTVKFLSDAKQKCLSTQAEGGSDIQSDQSSSVQAFNYWN